MSHLQSRMYAAMEEAQRARQKKREAADALRERQHEYETANLRGLQKQITRARAALEAAQACNPAGCGAISSDAWVLGRCRRQGISLASPPWMVSCAWAHSVSGRSIDMRNQR